MPSRLSPAWSYMTRAVLSQRNTPANPSPKGTTALLNMLLTLGAASRVMIGFLFERQTTSWQSRGRSSHGMFGIAGPTILDITVSSSFFSVISATMARHKMIGFHLLQ
jgi:hypothetical protein